MNKTDKLKVVVKEWEDKRDLIQQECSFARAHNFRIEADVLFQKYDLLNEILMDIRLRVVDELIKM